MKNYKANIIKYLSSQCIVLFGGSLVDYAIIWYITLETKSSALMAITMFFVFIPKIAISYFSGVWADKYNKKMILIYSNVILCVVTSFFGILFLNGIHELWLIWGVLSLRSILTGIQLPAGKALIPFIVPSSTLLKVNGINNSLESMIQILSPAIGGIVLTYYTLDIIAFIDVFCVCISIYILITLKIKDLDIIKIYPSTYFKEFIGSIKYINNNLIVKRLLGISFVLMFLIVALTLLAPLKITRNFGDEVWRLSLYETIYGIGCIIGGIVISLYMKIENNIKIICYSFMCIGILSTLLSLSNYFIILGVAFFIGFFIAFANSIVITVIQQYTDAPLLGRILGFTQIIASVSNLLGLSLFGGLGDYISLNYIFIFVSLAFISFSLYVLLTTKQIS